MLRIVSSAGIIVCELDVLDEEETIMLEQGNNSLHDFLSIFSIDSMLLPEPYHKVASTLGLSYNDALKIVPINKLKQVASTINSKLSTILSDNENATYLRNFIRMRRFLDSLKAPLIDDKKLSALISSQEHEGVKTNLNTFISNVPTKYSMSKSATGRLSVISGAKILTAPSEVKKTLKSRFEDGSILQIDLTSAEPNFSLFYANETPKKDLYEYCARTVLDNNVNRDVAKLVLLSAIYGQSEKNLRKNLPNNLSTSKVIKQVKSFLSINETKEKLMDSLNTNNFRNYLCRPLKTQEQRLLISHFLQSSVAECALLMFSDFCAAQDVIPIFVIHDALIIDCNKKKAKELLNQEFTFNFANTEFPASVSELA